MPDITTVPVQAVAPVSPQNAAGNAARGAEGAEEASQPSFSAVLKERSAGKAEAEHKQTPEKTSADSPAEALAEAAAPNGEVAPQLAALLVNLVTTPIANATAGGGDSTDSNISEAGGVEPAALMAATTEGPTALNGGAGQGAGTGSGGTAGEAAAGLLPQANTAGGTAKPADDAASIAAAATKAEASPSGAGESLPLAAPAEASAASSEASVAADNAATTGVMAGSETRTQAALQAFAAQAPAEASRPAPAAATQVIHTPVAASGWAEEIGQKLAISISQEMSKAELVLTPPQLGRVEVSIQMNGDQASAHFMIVNPAAREALQDALPRLREALAQSGIDLARSDVSAGQSGNEQQDGRGFGQGRGSRGGEGGGPAAMSGLGRWVESGRGVIDVFA